MKTADLEPATLFVIKTIELVALDKLVSIDQQALNKWIACATQRHIVIFALKMAAGCGDNPDVYQSWRRNHFRHTADS